VTAAPPLASLSVDLDNLWAYLKTAGHAGWETFPSYLDDLVPRVLQFLAERGLRVTVFVVGQDAALDGNRDALAAIAAAGHEVGNHSHRHEPWFGDYPPAEVDREIATAEEWIERATGRRPRGFRGPGYSISPAALTVLARRKYLYDASVLPTYLGPLARRYYFARTGLDRAERRRRSRLFGTLGDGRRPLRPYRWRLEAGELVEVPVTTVPLLRLPIHVSYLLYLSAVSRSLAINYFRAALSLCRMTGTPVSLLLHPLDFLGADDARRLDFFPGMALSGEWKMDLVSEIIDRLEKHARVVPLTTQVEETLRTSSLPLCEPGPVGRTSDRARVA
jgi:peptidoglycan/xylan/chitin deacetylase (PgdA/CDA1 family)